MFLALQFLPEESEEYKELTGRFLASINDGDTERRNNNLPSHLDQVRHDNDDNPGSYPRYGRRMINDGANEDVT